jgi:hypothetical protein
MIFLFFHSYVKSILHKYNDNNVGNLPFTEIFSQDNISSDPHAVPEQSAFDIDGDAAAFDTPPLTVRRDRRDPQPPNRYTPS